MSQTGHIDLLESVEHQLTDQGKSCFNRGFREEEDDSRRVLVAVKTCGACPSQWEVILTDRTPVYIRYRWGGLSIRFGQPGGTVQDAIYSQSVASYSIGDGMDGSIEWDEVRGYLKQAITSYNLGELGGR